MDSIAVDNRRRSPRIEVFAQAEVTGLDVHIMEVRNVSAGGIYLVGTSAEYPDLSPGVDLNLVIFGSEEGMGDDPDFNILCKARIIRVDLVVPRGGTEESTVLACRLFSRVLGHAGPLQQADFNGGV